MESHKKHWIRLSQLAIDSIIDEAVLSPKPGLVDSIDSGAHKDMNVALLVKSASSFSNSFYTYLICGFEHEGALPLLLNQVRQIGIIAEKNMFETTKGINTHKGANFSFAIILSALGYFFRQKGSLSTTLQRVDLDPLFSIVRCMTKGLVHDDLKNVHTKTTLTYGEQLYVRYGFTGIRGEAEAGYPILTNAMLPLFFDEYKKNTHHHMIYLQMLLVAMSVTEDSNIVSRGGFASLSFVKERALSFITNGGVHQDDYLQQLQHLNTVLIDRNLSPGGSADLLSVGIFLSKLCVK